MIWFDLDNSPHVPLFRPIFKELDNRKVEYIITARNFAQTKGLLEMWNINYNLIGRHGGKNKYKKIINLIERSFELRRFLNDKKNSISLAVSHGSRTQVMASKMLGIKSLVMTDYEFTESKIFNMFAGSILIPGYIPDKRLSDAGFNLKKVGRYNGFKEELYLSSFSPDPNFRAKLKIDDDVFLVVIRPPGMVGNYHDSKSEEILIHALKYFNSKKNVVCLIVNRTEYEKKFISSHFETNNNIRFLESEVDGLQLLHSADVAISGGGTMNREAALLGTKTYSIFTGRKPYLDEYLAQQGRLTFINNPGEVESIQIKKNGKKESVAKNSNLINEITDIILGSTEK